MKQLILFGILIIFTVGCTHVTVSNPDLLEFRNSQKNIKNSQIKNIPLSIKADMSCYEQRVGNGIKRTCSNKNRIYSIVKIFKENGLKAYPPAENESAPEISVRVKDLNGFLEGVTGFFNIISFGLLPLYHHTDYIVSLKDKEKNIELKEKVRVSSTTTLFSLFRSTPDEYKEVGFESKLEENLIRVVLEKANLSQ